MGTLEGFTSKEMLAKLTIPDGFVIDLRCWDNTILLTIEDHRAHADFEGDRSAAILTQLLDRLSDIDLDASKAIVSLGCRNEPLGAGRSETFNVGVVQLGWVIFAPDTRSRDASERMKGASSPRSGQLGVCRRVSFS